MNSKIARMKTADNITPKKSNNASAEIAKRKKVQTKLKVSQPGDTYEREADQVADQVMSMAGPAADAGNDTARISRLIQRQEEAEVSTKSMVMRQDEEEEEVQASPLLMRQEMPEEEEEEIQTKPWVMRQVEEEEEEEEVVQPKRENGGSASDSWISRQLHTGSSGTPLPGSTRNFMESRFGADFSSVRIHDDSKATRMSDEMNARAFTNRNHIYFNEGQYNPGTNSGKHLLAHELTHVVQQQGEEVAPKREDNDSGNMYGRNSTDVVQRDEQAPESSEEETGGTEAEQAETPEAEVTPESSATSPDPVTGFIADLLEDQLSDSTLRGHLSSLGDALESLAEEDTRTIEEGPADAGRRLAATQVSEAFVITSRAILADPALRNLREQIVSRVRENPELALAAALAGILVAALADIDISHEISEDVGQGFTIGGAFDFGSVQSIEFNRLQFFSQWANDYFRTRITNTLSTDEETDELTYTGQGDFRIGSELSNIAGMISINSDGEVVIRGSLTGGYEFGGGNRFVFSAGLQHSFAEGETIFTPGVSGRIDIGSDHYLRIGANAELTAGSGLTGLTGFLQLENDYLMFRIDGSLTGLSPETSIMPPIVPEVGGEPLSDMRIQGTLVIPLGSRE